MTQSSLHLPLLSGNDTSSASGMVAALRSRGVSAEIRCVNWQDAYPKAPESRAWLAHDGAAIHALFTIRTDELRAVATEDLQPVADDTCFEIFLKKAGDTHYCNFEFNYRGVANVSRRPGRAGAVKFTPDLLALIRRHPLVETQPHDCRRADPTAETALLVSIPLLLIGVEPGAALPLRLEGNIYSCSAKCREPYFLSWAPIATAEPDFHRPDFFVPIILDDNE